MLSFSLIGTPKRKPAPVVSVLKAIHRNKRACIQGPLVNVEPPGYTVLGEVGIGIRQ